MKYRHLLLPLSVLLLFPALALCADSTLSARDIVGKMQATYKNMGTVVADFSQELTIQTTATKKTEKGVFYFKKPSKMRWSYEEPNKKLLIVGKKTSWFYLPEKKLAYRQATDVLILSQTAVKLLGGVAEIEKDFVVALKQADADGYTLHLTPIEEMGAKEITIRVDGDNFLIMSCAFYDFYGNHNALTFKNMRTNTEISENLFVFNAPDGVQVVEIQ